MRRNCLIILLIISLFQLTAKEENYLWPHTDCVKNADFVQAQGATSLKPGAYCPYVRTSGVEATPRLCKRCFFTQSDRIELKAVSPAAETLSVMPIGWSHDGKLALLEKCYRADIAVTDYTCRIFDLLSDRELHRQTTPFKDMAIFSPALEKYKIIQGKGTILESFPLFTGNDEYNVTLESSIGGNAAIYRLFAESSRLGKKEIAGGEVREEKTIIGLEILGYLKSPYEERIAIITRVQPGTTLLITGCHLQFRFKK